MYRQHQHAPPHIPVFHGHPPPHHHIYGQTSHGVQFRVFPFVFTAACILLVVVVMKAWGRQKSAGG